MPDKIEIVSHKKREIVEIGKDYCIYIPMTSAEEALITGGELDNPCWRLDIIGFSEESPDSHEYQSFCMCKKCKEERLKMSKEIWEKLKQTPNAEKTQPLLYQMLYSEFGIKGEEK